MKKIFWIFALCAILGTAVFADEYEDEDISFESDSTEKMIGFTPGIRFSVLGIEPTFSLNLSHLELEGSCIMSTGLKGEQFGYAPSVSVGYNTNPFERGSFAVFGGEYMCLSSMYITMLANLLNNDNEEDLPAIHSVSLFYKGGVNFTNRFGMIWRVRFPLVIAGAADGETYSLNVTNLAGFGGCTLVGLSTISMGIKLTL